MPDKSGFIDLRIGHGAQGIGDDSVWPSFTDIMTVIVMIFLMALVIMMVRNFELDRRLVTTMSAQEASFSENRGLVDQLNVLESRMLDLQQSLGASEIERDTLRVQLLQELKRIQLMAADKVTLEDQIVAILEERNQLALERQQLAEREQLTSESLAIAQVDNQALSKEVLELRQQRTVASEQLATAQVDNQALSQEVLGLRQQRTVASEQLATAQVDNQTLSREILGLQQQNRVAGEQLATAQSEKISLVDRVQALLNRSSALDQQRIQAEQRNLDLTANETKLSQKIAALSDQFDTLRIRSDSEIVTLSTANLSLSERLELVSSQLDQVKTLLQTEQQQRLQLGVQVEAQTRELLNRQELLERLKLIQQQSTKRFADANSEIDRLTELISQRQAENAELQTLADASGVKFRSLQDEYESLGVKYRKLVRPARSSVGKYLVEVWIVKSSSGYRYQLREPSQSAPVSYPRPQLDRRLASLKTEQGKNLYTKVVIPEYSGLSYNEAWRFTEEILRSYDYYYQQYPNALSGSSTVQ